MWFCTTLRAIYPPIDVGHPVICLDRRPAHAFGASRRQNESPEEVGKLHQAPAWLERKPERKTKKREPTLTDQTWNNSPGTPFSSGNILPSSEDAMVSAPSIPQRG